MKMIMIAAMAITVIMSNFIMSMDKAVSSIIMKLIMMLMMTIMIMIMMIMIIIMQHIS